ncbi:MAG: hydroxymethylbilane synthase [Lachnospiraceae bacterium]|jgi:hydroxymethylbilane synthase|nr:hydroxymethylbilane synthase [Lachnospiraceae bacterium]MCI1328526.1 hydroxymethylbilane synthase [Lachnospiraceae bacterium]
MMKKRKKIVIGSRGSMLAVAQSRLVIRYLNEAHPELDVELLTMKTTGDRILDRRLDQAGGKGLFVKELDQALISRRSDFSVHSLKDLPMEVPEELPIVAYSGREDPRDVLVLPEGVTEIDLSKPIGTSSKRRILQLQKLFPEAVFESIRGNLQTRLGKLDEGRYGAIVLAAAGMKRLGIADRISRYFSVDEVIPAAGQGILAVQGRKDEDASFFEGFADGDAAAAAAAERAFVRYLDGGCSSPVAAHAVVFESEQALQKAHGDVPMLLSERGSSAEDNPKRICLRGLYFDEKSGAYRTGDGAGCVSDAEALGAALAQRLRAEASVR